MRRILVIGSPGAGKSTLARRLAQRLGLPLIHLDREYFGPGWTMPPRDEWREKVKGLAARPEWVMDGNYASTFDLRVPRATVVIWLDVGRWRCLASVTWRVLKNYGRVRDDLGPDCIEKFDWSFMRWIWKYQKDMRPKTTRMLARLRPDQQLFVLRSRSQIPSLEETLLSSAPAKAA
ncbi:AAA family ATPase [Microvirga terricola]|uniref:AAA family ATPase n=1 Tax=Microvirga terricola TaxID=2719797 RepID=A0ABX0VC97_9HYPH|nr:AAA family ATPase [Microvirga terricola]NIX77469.1 AAA family ATPase [Microvirga terricola]